MEKYYCFAGVELLIDLPDDKMYIDGRMLEPFRVEAVSQPHCFRLEMVEQLPSPVGEYVAGTDRFRVYQSEDRQIRYFGVVEDGWDKAYARAEHRGMEHRVLLKASRFPDRVGANIVMNCLAAEHLVALAGGFILHSAYINWGGKGILFTAPSGTGKSTQAALWEQLRGAEIINGDRSAVRIESGTAVACGIPFAGSSGICKNRTLPLAAIVYLSQAKETTIRRLTGFGAFRAIWEGCSVNTWDGEDVRLVSKAVQRVSEAVPVFHLACRPDVSAVEALEGLL